MCFSPSPSQGEGRDEGKILLNPRQPLKVVAGVLTNSSGEVLINQRSQPAQFDGQWEFPGGKIEPGETLHQALARELKEELGIEVLASTHLISITHDYPHATVQLNVRNVTEYTGTPTGAEGQAIQWVQPDDLFEVNFLEANGPIIEAVLEMFKLPNGMC
ncbi:8-oxo-dGTP diphosphatase MutT [Pseudomonadota bacterium]